MTIMTGIILIIWVISVGCMVAALCLGDDLLLGGGLLLAIIGVVLSYIEVAIESGWF